MKNPIIVLGTASGVGKSTVALALCRYFWEKGLSVAPFKGLNMARHGYSLPDGGGQIGIGQGMQALACGVLPTGLMNPVFLKPQGGNTALFLIGKYHATTQAGRTGDYTEIMRETACAAFDTLRERYEMIVMEGSGSCGEINLKDQDVANLFMADYAKADIILVADIDRGGVFASIVGTLGLMDQDNRSRVKGVIINRFRGDPERFREAAKQLEFITGVPVLGIIPWFDPGITAEDDVGAEIRNTAGLLDIAVVQMPNMSSNTDIMPLMVTPGIGMRHVSLPTEMDTPDLIILPGSYNAMDDNDHIHKTGLHRAIRAAHARGSAVFGICGGLQIMGARLENPERIEGNIPGADGLGFFSYTTIFRKDRIARISSGEAFLQNERFEVTGRENHCGHTDFGDITPFTLYSDGSPTGVMAPEQWLYATYKHGIFENIEFTQCLVDRLLMRRGMQAGVIQVPDYSTYNEVRFDAIRRHVVGQMDLPRMGL